jgi:hypothetical protein
VVQGFYACVICVKKKNLYPSVKAIQKVRHSVCWTAEEGGWWRLTLQGLWPHDTYSHVLQSSRTSAEQEALFISKVADLLTAGMVTMLTSWMHTLLDCST